MKTLDMCFKFILDNDDAYLLNVDKLITKVWIMDNYHIDGELTISDDLVVDCSGRVDVKNKSIESLTNGLFRWGKVNGYFNCSNCKNLKSLEGGPKEVMNSFWCSGCNNLTSLEGAPKKTGGGFYCNVCNNLTSLEGAPKEVGWDFKCCYCSKLKSLKGGPEKIGGIFDCDNCPNLTITDSERGRCGIMK